MPDYEEMYFELLQKFDNMVPKKLYEELREEVTEMNEKNKKLSVQNARLKDNAVSIRDNNAFNLYEFDVGFLT